MWRSSPRERVDAVGLPQTQVDLVRRLDLARAREQTLGRPELGPGQLALQPGEIFQQPCPLLGRGPRGDNASATTDTSALVFFTILGLIGLGIPFAVPLACTSSPTMSTIFSQPSASIWTGTWRDPRFSPPADGGRPENALTGTAYMSNNTDLAMQVPADIYARVLGQELGEVAAISEDVTMVSVPDLMRVNPSGG